MEGLVGRHRRRGVVRREGLRRGRAAGPAAKPPTRAQPVCFDAVETACGPVPAGSKILRRAGRCGMIDGGKNHGTFAEGRAEQCRKR